MTQVANFDFELMLRLILGKVTKFLMEKFSASEVISKILTVLLGLYIMKKSMPGKFLQDISLEYFVIFGAIWLLFGTDTTQPFQSVWH